jgi:hypothetical protein
MQQQYMIDMAGITGSTPASQLIHLPMQQAAAAAQRSLVTSLRRNIQYYMHCKSNKVEYEHRC